MEYDGAEWREKRNNLLKTWLGDQNAVTFVLTLAQIAEVWDDLIDGDKEVSRDEINRAFFLALVELQVNPFFDRYRISLLPIIISGMNAWMDANAYEQGDDESRLAFAYVLRDWYMEIINMCIYLLRGYDAMRELSIEIREFFVGSETFDAYKGGL